MTIHRIRTCKCGHEETVHDGNGCHYGAGIAGAISCECEKFRTRGSFGSGKRRAEPKAQPTTALDALKAAAEFLTLAIGLLEKSAITSPKAFGKTGREDLPKFGEADRVPDAAIYGSTGVGKTSFKKKDNGERKILIAVAQHRAGATRKQISILTGYKTSTRNEYLSRLKKRGHVQDDGDTFYVTDSGRIFLGDDFKLLPKGVELREYWLNKLPEGESAILELACAAYPKAVTREYLSTETAFATSTRNEYISRLVRRKLVVAPRNGHVTASKELF